MGFGPVATEVDEPLFHAGWEARALALTLACGALGHWTLDESRHARESLPWGLSLTASYYKIWVSGLEMLLERHREVSEVERAAGSALHPGRRPERRLRAEDVAPTMARGGPSDRATAHLATFAVGDLVRTRSHHPPGHTRLPGYALGKTGTITALHGAHVFPDTNAHGQGEKPAPLYTVTFSGETLWGAGGEPDLTVSIDAWEPYLERA